MFGEPGCLHLEGGLNNSLMKMSVVIGRKIVGSSINISARPLTLKMDTSVFPKHQLSNPPQCEITVKEWKQDRQQNMYQKVLLGSEYLCQNWLSVLHKAGHISYMKILTEI
jgi:hypothetical protein